MPDGNKPFLNDNLRTPHLKCDRCQMQVFLERIDRLTDGSELRTFRCGHCDAISTLRINAAGDNKMLPQQQGLSRDRGGQQRTT